MYVFLYARVHTHICMHVWLRLFQTLVDAIKVLLKVWQLSVCIVIIHMILMNGSQFSGSTPIEDDFSSNGVRLDFNNVQHICVLASCLFLSLTSGEVMDEDYIWSQSPATRHSAASTKAHCKQVCVFSLIHNFPLKHFKF
jgi:hypothetical protein